MSCNLFEKSSSDDDTLKAVFNPENRNVAETKNLLILLLRSLTNLHTELLVQSPRSRLASIY